MAHAQLYRSMIKQGQRYTHAAAAGAGRGKRRIGSTASPSVPRRQPPVAGLSDSPRHLRRCATCSYVCRSTVRRATMETITAAAAVVAAALHRRTGGGRWTRTRAVLPAAARRRVSSGAAQCGRDDQATVPTCSVAQVQQGTGEAIGWGLGARSGRAMNTAGRCVGHARGHLFKFPSFCIALSVCLCAVLVARI